MLRPYVLSTALLAALLTLAGCASPRPADSAKARPSAQQVARQAGDTAKETQVDDLVLYSTSSDEAEAVEADQDGDQGARPDGTEAVEEPANEEPADEASDDEEIGEDAADEQADEPADNTPDGEPVDEQLDDEQEVPAPQD